MTKNEKFIKSTIEQINAYSKELKEVFDEYKSRLHTIRLKRDPKNKTINLIFKDDLQHIYKCMKKHKYIIQDAMVSYDTQYEILHDLLISSEYEIDNEENNIEFCKNFCKDFGIYYIPELTVTENLNKVWEKLYYEYKYYYDIFFVKAGVLQENCAKIMKAYESTEYTCYIDGYRFDKEKEDFVSIKDDIKNKMKKEEGDKEMKTNDKYDNKYAEDYYSDTFGMILYRNEVFIKKSDDERFVNVFDQFLRENGRSESNIFDENLVNAGIRSAIFDIRNAHASSQKPTANIHNVQLVCDYYGLKEEDIIDYAKTLTLNLYGEFDRKPDLLETLYTLSGLLLLSPNEYVDKYDKELDNLLTKNIKPRELFNAEDVETGDLLKIADAFKIPILSLIEIRKYSKCK